MDIYLSFSELAKGIKKEHYEIEKAWEKWIGSGYMYIGEIEITKHIKDDKLHFIVFNHEDNNDCKKYMMDYEINEYDWKVYVDDIEGWQECNVIDINNPKLSIYRAKVVTQTGTQLYRRVKFVLDEDDEEFKADGCIYFMEKNKKVYPA